MRHRVTSGVIMAAVLIVPGQALSHSDPLPSWNDGPAGTKLASKPEAIKDWAALKLFARQMEVFAGFGETRTPRSAG